MLVGISFDHDQVVKQQDGLLVLRLNSPHHTPPWLYTVKGDSPEEYAEGKALQGGHLVVGERGRIRFVPYK